jgi:hypothetical protein
VALDFLHNEQEKQHFKDLLAAKDQLIPYVGAGFSYGPCPGWHKFLTSLFEQIKADFMTKAQINEYNALITSDDANDFEAVLDLLFKCAGFGTIRTLVQKTFGLPFPTEFTRKFQFFHQAFKGPWLTTNVDRFIEAAFTDSPDKITTLYGSQTQALQQSLNQGDLSGYLLKLHGDVRTPSSWVLNQAHYQQAYGAESGFDINSPLPAFLKQLFTNQSLLFIGCSLAQDRPMQILEQLMQNSGARPHFALLSRTIAKGDKLIKFKRRLSNLNITPIWLDDFDDIELVLEQLAPAAVIATKSKPSIKSPDIFVGREKELNELINALKRPGTVHAVTGQLFNLIGIGGIGKTTLAREAMNRCSADFADGCFEIRVDDISPQRFAMELVRLLGLDLAEPSNSEEAQQYIAQMLNQYKLLLLLDNVNTTADLLKLLPEQYQSSVIVTSRDQDLADTLRIKRRHLIVSESHLTVFNQAETLALFKAFLGKKYQPDEESNYLGIAKALGFLPIALRLAITTMVFGQHLSAKALLSQLQSSAQLQLINKALKHEANDDERSISAVFDLSGPLLTAQLKQTLALLAVCSQGPVPVDFLAVLNTDLDDMVLTNSLATLQRYSWCHQKVIDEVTHYELHQLVREVIATQLVDEALNDYFVDIVQLHFIEKPQHFLVRDRWLPQTDVAVERLRARGDERLIDWAAWNDFGPYCANRSAG